MVDALRRRLMILALGYGATMSSFGVGGLGGVALSVREETTGALPPDPCEVTGEEGALSGALSGATDCARAASATGSTAARTRPGSWST